MTLLADHPVSRRRFLTGATSFGLASGLPARPDGAWRMRLSCSSVAFSKLPVDQACERIAALGFEAVDFWAPNWCDHLDVLQADYGPNGARELLAKNNLKLYAFSVYRPGYRKYAELLGQLGGGVAVRDSRPKLPRDLTAEMKAFLEGLKPDLELAEKYDSYIAIENHGNALLHTLDSFKAFVDLNTHSRLGIAMAPYHLQRAGAPVEEAIKVTGKQLLFFYAWQDAKDMNQLPGVGPADFTPWLEALAATGYEWYVNPFMHHEPAPDIVSKALRTSCDYLKDCHSRIGS